MIRDIYNREADSAKFDPNRLEVTDTLSQFLLKIENTLFTRRHEVLGASGFGANLDDLLFSLISNESQIRNRINSQISNYCLNGPNIFSYDTKVQFFKTVERSGALIEIFINDQRALGVVF